MTLVLDTSILISLERKETKIINHLKKLKNKYPSPPQIAFITYYEFLRGLKTRKPKKYDGLLNFLNTFKILPTNKKTAEILADLRIEQETKGTSLPLADLLIASQVIENNLILITKDKDFEKINKLKKIIF